MICVRGATLQRIKCVMVPTLTVPKSLLTVVYPHLLSNTVLLAESKSLFPLDIFHLFALFLYIHMSGIIWHVSLSF